MSTATTVSPGGTAPPLLDLAGALGSAAAGAGPAANAASFAGAGAAKTSAGKAGTAKAGGAKASSAAGKAGTTKSATAAKKASTARKAAGYAVRLPAEFAFLRDGKLTIEEKLSRFISLVMSRAEKDLLAQMERMAPGSTVTSTGGGASGRTAAGTSASGAAAGAPPVTAAPAAPRKKRSGLWGVLKVVLPQVGIAAKLLGDAKVKALVQQLTGPVLAAAATALGHPYLAPVALQAGSALAGALEDEEVDEPAKAGGTAAAGGTVAAGGASQPLAAAALASGSASTSSGTRATSGSAASAESEKAQQLQLQRLVDKEKEMFTLLSNMLRSMHETRMASIANIR
jgi:hypothetical protein